MDINALMGALGPMQQALNDAGAERGKERLQGQAGGGAVRITITGDLKVGGVTIAPAAAAAAVDDASMLEDLIQVALQDALQQYGDRFGRTPDEQIQKLMSDGGGDMMAMLGPLLGGLGGR